MTDLHFDVLVVGSGPAGSIAALVLAPFLTAAHPGVARGIAAMATGLGHALTARSADRRWIAAQLDGSTKGA